MAVITLGPTIQTPVKIEDLNVDLMLRYQGAGSAHTERIVTLKSLDGWLEADGSVAIGTLRGYCHMRRMARTFQMRRVTGLFDPKTGEQIANLLAYAGLDKNLKESSRASK